MRNLPLLFILLLCTWGPASNCQAQTPDTVITVTKLPYPEARIFVPPVREGLAPSLVAPTLDTTSYPDYESCIQTRHTRLREADLATLQESKKGAWLKYLPTVRAGLAPALGFNPNGEAQSRLSPTLSVGLNSSLIYQAHRDKQQRAATRESIIKRSQLQEDQEIAKLHRLQRRLQIETNKLNLHDGVADIDRQLFTLYQKQYDNHDISPEEYLLKRKAFLLQELRNKDQITRIEALQYEIEDLAGCLTTMTSELMVPTRK
ncbi:hypothetical protein [Neolewinella persica]|uniref:hypothetical protein n=1 Tax=Neolewinella persica TaxID=70998 RepID=UPI000376C2DF|nr:hypothetical protein [Neolewinella persica]